MPEHRFETHAPVDLYVEIGKGSVSITCADTTESTVSIEGSGAEEVSVEQRGDELHVLEPHRSGLFRDTSLRVEVVVPLRSNPAIKTGSADVRISGPAGHAQLRTGSGDIAMDDAAGQLLVETGSGDVDAGDVQGDVRVKSGSGDIALGAVSGDLRVSTGSGDVRVAASYGESTVKTGSGDLHVLAQHGALSLTTGSGDLLVDRVDRGQVGVKGASGDVKIGVVAGVPVWTDISTVSGSIRSELRGGGQPQDGQDHVEVRAKTVSGDIALVEA